MKVLFGVTLAAMVLVVGSAPTLSMGQVPGITDPRQEYYRDVRSQYPQYVSPCAAAAAAAAYAPNPAIAPATAYQLNIAPYHAYPQQPQQYYGAAPHYRSMESETMTYSDMENMNEYVPMMRYVSPAGQSYVPTTSASGPVFGVFPNANSGGCNVPLLFSCTPSVVPGHVVSSQPQHASANAYRGVDAPHHEAHESHEEALPEHLTAHETTNHAMMHQ